MEILENIVSLSRQSKKMYSTNLFQVIVGTMSFNFKSVLIPDYILKNNEIWVHLFYELDKTGIRITV